MFVFDRRNPDETDVSFSLYFTAVTNGKNYEDSNLGQGIHAFTIFESCYQVQTDESEEGHHCRRGLTSVDER